MGVLLLNEDMLVSILSIEYTLGLYDDAVREYEIGSVLGVPLRDRIAYLHCLILIRNSSLLKVLGDLRFET
nr:hypothetical protein [Tardibacter chloracetimidivorans]